MILPAIGIAAAADCLLAIVAWRYEWQKPSAPTRPSVAVLPFANLSGDPSQDYFADGITEDLITDLAKLSGVDVIARNSVFAYKGKPVVLADVGARSRRALSSLKAASGAPASRSASMRNSSTWQLATICGPTGSTAHARMCLPSRTR